MPDFGAELVERRRKHPNQVERGFQRDEVAR